MATNEELAVMIQNGERDKLPELWDQVKRFVRLKAMRRSRSLDGFGGVTWEDLYQSGYIALVAAADSYNPLDTQIVVGQYKNKKCCVCRKFWRENTRLHFDLFPSHDRR